MNRPLPPDQQARDRVRSDLDTNFLVEAGAGSGKTTLMAERVVALIAAGRPADQIAAVTFTRKAAAELRERVQLVLEQRAQNPALANDVFVGTIHSFCARLLRERPVEAGLDPRFRELDDAESTQLTSQWWDAWLERLHVNGDPQLAALTAVGIDAAMLGDAFKTFVQYPDVDFAAPATPAPKTTALRRELDRFIADGFRLMPSEEPDGGWDDVQRCLWQLRFDQRSRDWGNAVDLFDSLSLIGRGLKVTQKDWVRSESTAKEDKAAAKAYGEALVEWRNDVVESALTEWYEHRYAPVATLLRAAAQAFEAYRIATGRLSFEDLLLRAAALLRTDASARSALGERWRYVLVDEFQDTDPVQAEVLFLLGSTPRKGDASPQWGEATLRAGALFVVGDPKQSIYRFRRADIETYEAARTAIERQGACLRLTANFRSLPVIADFVNAHFNSIDSFPPEPSPYQAAFAPLQPMKGASDATLPDARIDRYEIAGGRGESNKDVVIRADAALISSFIASEIAAGRAHARDFLILTRRKESLAEHARQLAARGVAVAVSGAAVAFEAELHELQLLLNLMHDPSNAVLTAAVLEGRFFGVSPADLWAAHQAGVRFAVSAAAAVVHADARVRRVVDALGTLHAWLERSRREAPDVFVSRLLSETGLLAFTAAGDLGDVRAGLLVRLLEDIRSATLDPESAGNAAQDALARLLDDEVPDSPLLPGRENAVRVMNLHKAKGLEGEVVILAAPTEASDRAPRVAVRRENGVARGGMQIAVAKGYQSTVLAQPPKWDVMRDTEARFAAGENERLLYVAATRAKQRLIVSEFVSMTAKGAVKKDNREWSGFMRTLDDMKIGPLDLAITAPSGRPVLPDAAADVAARAAEAQQRLSLAAEPGWEWTTVTASAKGESLERRSLDDVSKQARGEGAAFGRAVHRLLEIAGRQLPAPLTYAAIARVCAEELIGDRASAVADALQRVFAGGEWRELTGASERRFEWPIAGWLKRDEGEVFIEGVIDAAWKTGERWEIVDWKTDRVEGAAWDERLTAYLAQVATYTELLATALRVPVKARVVRVR